MVPQAFAGLESLAAPDTRVRSQFRVDSLMRSNCGRVLESFSALSARFIGFASVFEERVLLQVITFFETDRTDVTNERSVVTMCPLMVLEVGVLRERLETNLACPFGRLRWRGCHSSLRR